MIRKLTAPFAMVLVGGLAITALAAVWLRNTIAGVPGKNNSDRTLKRDITPVTW